MYLIFKESQLLGYTYEKLALAAFIKVCKEHNEKVSFKECPEDVLMKKGVVKSQEHIRNLVTWYSKQPASTCWYHHYIRMNTKLLQNISWEFRREVHKMYFDLYMKDLMEGLCDLLDESYHKPIK